VKRLRGPDAQVVNQDEIPTVKQSTSLQRAPVFQGLVELIEAGLCAAAIRHRTEEQRKSKVLAELDIQGAIAARRRLADVQQLLTRTRRLASRFRAWGDYTTDEQRTADVLALRELERDAADHGVKA
jgi:hypothetical protein